MAFTELGLGADRRRFVAMLGLVESFLYGAYAGLVFCPIYNLLHRRWGAQANPNA